MESKKFTTMDRLNDYLRLEGSMYEIQIITNKVIVLKDMSLKRIK